MQRTKHFFMALISAAVMASSATAVMAQSEGADIFVIGGKPDDPFWSKVKRSADDAALVVKAQGGSVTWLGPQNYDNLGPDAADLIRTALSQNPDAIVGPDWVPEGHG
jgi:simple sugar transport system substrate-binding protein